MFTTVCRRTAILVLAAAACQTVVAQERTVPREEYFLALVPYFDGDFGLALKQLKQVARSGVRNVDGLWVDSICYFTMIGECHYQMGENALALENYTQALRLYLAQAAWMQRVRFPATIDVGSRARRMPTWGPSARRSRPGAFPNSALSLQGRMDNQQVLQQGGVVVEPELVPLRVNEVVRCTALAIKRRRELLGPTGVNDPLITALIVELARRPAPPNHWSQVWVDVELGLAHSAAGQTVQAVTVLQNALVMGTGLDHPLTPLALLELGHLALEQGQHQAAGRWFLEASLSAALFDQPDVIEESLRGGLQAHLASGQKGLYAPLPLAIAWADRDFPKLRTSLLIALAENASAAGDAVTAAKHLDAARRTIGKGGMASAAIGARLSYHAGLVSFQMGHVPAGNTAFAAAMLFQKGCSQRLFQITLADAAWSSGAISDRVAAGLYETVLREPTTKDWTTDPMETLAVAMNPPLAPLEHWLELSIRRKEFDKALEIADRLRRQRFYSTLPVGARLLALRWILESPESSLPANAKLQRQDFLLKYPRYAELSRQAAATRAALDQAPLVPGEKAQADEQKKLFLRLGECSLAQEAILAELALRREATDYVFPPLRELKSIQEQLSPRTVVASYLVLQRAVIGFYVTKNDCKVFPLESPERTRRDVADMLRDMGHFDRNLAIGAEKLKDRAWRTPAKRLAERLLKHVYLEGCEELVLVPDGVLWYVPFEALPYGDGEQPLLTQFRLRYVPTVSLAIPDGRTTRPMTKSAIVGGPLLLRQSREEYDAVAEDFCRSLPGTARLSDSLPAPSGLLRSVCDGLIVLRDLEDASRGPYDWSPVQLDRGKAGSSLANWLTLPWGGPDFVVLPTFHTPAESALKTGGAGDEIFLSLCGLMASGTRTVLLSRWRTGGQTTYDLVREFAQELPHQSASRAWQRSVQLGMKGDLDLSREPRIKEAKDGRQPTAEHPFFWSGYLLADMAANERQP